MKVIDNLVEKYKSTPIPVRASFWFLICSFLQRGVSTITTPIFTRLLSTAEYGQFSTFNSWMSILSVLITLNLCAGVFTSGLIRFEDKRREFASAMQGLCLALVLAWTAVYFIFRDFWNQLFSLTTVQMLAMILMVWAKAVFKFWSIEQRVDFHYRKLVFVTLAVSVSMPLLGIVFVLLAQDKVTARILSIALLELIVYTGFFFAQMRRGKKFFVKDVWKYALRFNLPLIPHYLSMSVLSSTDRIMINNMVGSDAAGIYNLAYSISLIMTMFNTALLQTIEPWLYKQIKAKKIENISKVAYPTFIMIAAANIALIALAPEIVSIFAPVEYHEAIWIVPPVAMSVYFMFSYTFFAVFEFYYGKTKWIAIATTSGAALNILLNLIFIPIFGYYSAGYTTLVCYVVYAVFHYFFMKRVCRAYLNDAKAYDTRVILFITACFMVVGFIFMTTYHYIVARYMLIAITFAFILIFRKMIFSSAKQILGVRQKKD